MVPQWEVAFLTIGFAGMALGLAVAVPIYLRERWPRAFLGRVGQGRPRLSKPVTAAMAVAVGLGLLWYRSGTEAALRGRGGRAAMVCGTYSRLGAWL
ncbi:hypothetical protein [Actinomadura sp. 9N407]|uniref:hypothetical protein n=1 Tax=Actinomadura sp. 9N407 TaxID=3375154 RepID=UPI0037AB697F